MTDKNRPIELYRLKDNGIWDTVFVEIPADTDPNEIEEVARIHAAAQIGPGVYMLYNGMDDQCPETKILERVECVVMLCFDLGQTTVGTTYEQVNAAIEQVDFVLQRQPHGLGARISKILS